MGQLIDKTVLRKELSKLPSEMGFVRKSDVMQILGNQKCAYDVDKVIEELKQESRNVSNDMISDLCYEAVLLKVAIDIVKDGEICQ